jgi:hypothetical protein
MIAEYGRMKACPIPFSGFGMSMLNAGSKPRSMRPVSSPTPSS